MNKQAAEKLATEYYTYGIELALHNAGIQKNANLLGSLGGGLQKLLGNRGVQMGAAGVAGAKYAPEVLAALAKAQAGGAGALGSIATGAEGLLNKYIGGVLG
jgi:hypothetical protein